VTVPEPSLLPQCEGLVATSLAPNEVADGTTVLFPFMLNHIIGKTSPADSDGRNALKAWVNEILKRDGRVVVADLHASKAAEFWSTITEMFDVDADATEFNFCDSIGEVAGLYDGSLVQSRRGSSNIATATVLVMEGENRYFL
jgi:hypothetical protein